MTAPQITGTVLVLEADDGVRYAIVRILTEQGYTNIEEFAQARPFLVRLEQLHDLSTSPQLYDNFCIADYDLLRQGLRTFQAARQAGDASYQLELTASGNIEFVVHGPRRNQPDPADPPVSEAGELLDDPARPVAPSTGALRVILTTTSPRKLKNLERRYPNVIVLIKPFGRQDLLAALAQLGQNRTN